MYVQNPVVLDEYNEPLPDLTLLRPRDDYRLRNPTPEDVLLLIEVADSSVEYDRRIKAARYAQRGVPEYWLLDLPRDVVLVHLEPGPNGYGVVRPARRGERLTPSLLPDLELTVEEILA